MAPSIGQKLLPRSRRSSRVIVLVGLASSGLHTNGYSLARKVLSEMDLNDPLPDGDGVTTVGEALLAVHRSYLRPLAPALEPTWSRAWPTSPAADWSTTSPGSCPMGCGATIETTAWPRPPLFQFLVRVAGLSKEEAHQILNMGIGMVAVVAPDRRRCPPAASIPESTWVIGRVVAGDGVDDRLTGRPMAGASDDRPTTGEPSRLVVMVSGSGTNLQAILERLRAGARGPGPPSLDASGWSW